METESVQVAIRVYFLIRSIGCLSKDFFVAFSVAVDTLMKRIHRPSNIRFLAYCTLRQVAGIQCFMFYRQYLYTLKISRPLNLSLLNVTYLAVNSDGHAVIFNLKWENLINIGLQIKVTSKLVIRYQ